jgi:hypothetical protein
MLPLNHNIPPPWAHSLLPAWFVLLDEKQAETVCCHRMTERRPMGVKPDAAGDLLGGCGQMGDVSDVRRTALVPFAARLLNSPSGRFLRVLQIRDVHVHSCLPAGAAAGRKQWGSVLDGG